MTSICCHLILWLSVSTYHFGCWWCFLQPINRGSWAFSHRIRPARERRLLITISHLCPRSEIFISLVVSVLLYCLVHPKVSEDAASCHGLAISIHLWPATPMLRSDSLCNWRRWSRLSIVEQVFTTTRGKSIEGRPLLLSYQPLLLVQIVLNNCATKTNFDEVIALRTRVCTTDLDIVVLALLLL